ncbi:hypothetical protein AC1031_005650 [Aphanomyces cochlioides]|nr:hypothetical protein AC1031_005650 [Aphanomyces cochlioides]
MGHCLSSEVLPDLSTVSTTPRRSHRATKQPRFHMDEPQDLAIDWSQFQALVPLREAFFIPPQSIQHVQELPSGMHAACRVYIDGEATCQVPPKDVAREMSELQLRTALRTGRLRPAPSAKCPPEVAKHCLQFDPRNRQRSSRLLKMLLTAQASLNKPC